MEVLAASLLLDGFMNTFDVINLMVSSFSVNCNILTLRSMARDLLMGFEV